jgi:preprotein translocase subunit SecY
MKRKHEKKIHSITTKVTTGILAVIGSIIMIYGLTKARCECNIVECIPQIIFGLVMMIPGWFVFKDEESEDGNATK